ncbi:MAG: NADPH-dependent F420 reductase [Rubrivivax sp.]
MKIAIIGAGNVGRALGVGWAAKGHQLRFGARDVASDKVRAAVAATPGATAHPVPEAARWAEVVVLATPWSGTEAALRAAGDLGGKPLLDATNPLTPDFKLALGHTDSGGEQVQRWAQGAQVVKIFNTTGWENMAAPAYPAGRAAMLYCGDDAPAKAAASQLAADLGFEPLDLGPLAEARLLEPAAMVWIKLAIVRQQGRGIAFGLLRR